MQQTPTTDQAEPTLVRRWHGTLTSTPSIALAYLVWFALLGELAYATYYVRVMRQVSPRIEASGDGCATICFTGFSDATHKSTDHCQPK